MELSYPPFETIDEKGDPAGVSVDLAKALADYLHRPLTIENIAFTGLIPSLQNHRIDCVISSMTDTEERRKSIAFSDPYLTIGLAFLVSKDSQIATFSDADAPGKKIVVRQGTTGELWARQKFRHAVVLSIEKENMAVLEVIQGKADAFVYDQMSVWQYARKNSASARALLEPLQQEHWAVGLRKNDQLLKQSINAFLRDFRESGGLERLGDKFLRDQKESFKAQGIPFYL